MILEWFQTDSNRRADGGLSPKKKPASRLNKMVSLRHDAMLTPDGSLAEPRRNDGEKYGVFLEKACHTFHRVF
jgi:hypothetical protein